MLTWIREKFGTVLIGLIVAFIAFVFVFSGVYSPDISQSPAVVGTVNGEAIGMSEFDGMVRAQAEFMKNLFGGQGNIEQHLQDPRLKRTVFDNLVRKKLMVQEAARQGIMASDEQVRERIKTMPYFQDSGAFSVVKYRQVLAANGHSAESFEKLMREDLASEQWGEYFKARVQVSEDELKQEFVQSQDRRNIKYVLLTADVGRKGVQVSDEEVKTYLSDAAKKNLVQAQYEMKKATEHKGQTLEMAQAKIARELIAGEKIDEIRKVNEGLADRVLPLLAGGNGNDAAVNAILKSYGAEVKSTGWVTRQASYLPGIGEARELTNDAFAPKSPIDASQGGKAKKYSSANWVLVALVAESQKPDLTKLESERSSLVRQVSSRKERELHDSFMQQLQQKADIEPNEAILGKES